MKLYYIGMDVHSDNCTFCAGDANGNELRTGEVKTSMEGFREMIGKVKAKVKSEEPRLVVGMESGNQSFQAVMMLRKLGVEAHIYHAKEVRDKANNKRQKNDKSDAKEIYQGLWRGYYRQEVWVPSENELLVRNMASRFRGYVKTRASQINRAKGLLRDWMLKEFSNTGLTTVTAWKKLIKKIEGISADKWSEMVIWELDKKEYIVEELKRCYQVWKAAHDGAQALEDELPEAIKKLSTDQQKGIERVDKMFGVGFVSAVIFVLAIGDPKRFKNSSQVKKYFGFAPTENSSGGRRRKGKMDKQGNKHARVLAVELSEQAGRVSHPLHPLYMYIFHKKGNWQIARSVVAAKMLQIIWRMLRDKEDFDPNKLNVKYVMMETLLPSGNTGLKMVAVKKRNLKRYLKEHNLSEDYVMDELDRALAKKRLAKMAGQLGETDEPGNIQKEA